MKSTDMGIPALYDYRNLYNSSFAPSTIHAQDTGLAFYFQRYLIQKIMAVFEFKGIPKNWDKSYFMYSLFIFGFVAVVKTDRYGVIPQHCSLSGYNIYYRPTNAVIANPLLRGIMEPRIGYECALIKMQPDYGGAWDIVAYYADLMALATESLGTNLVNSKLAYVFGAEDSNMAESFKKLYDTVASGEPAVFVDKQLFDEEGNPRWFTFDQNLKQNYIANDILQDLAKIDSRFNTDIGIPNVNIAKESGVGRSEIEANNIDTKAKCSIWLETIREGLEEVKNIFGLDITVNLRFNNEMGDLINE
jgi:hypothetical protein